MGGVFSAPKIDTPVVVEQENTTDSIAEERKKALERQRRGAESTIKTSYAGVLDTKNISRKKLLGE